MEILAALAEKAATSTVGCVWQQIRYVLDYNDNITNLKDKLQDLKDAKSVVERQVREATTRSEQIDEDVGTWISRVDTRIAEAADIVADADKTCCGFKNRYKPSKRAKLQAFAIEKLEEQRFRFDRFSHGEPLHHLVLPNDDYEAFKSRQITLNSIMDALRNREASLIGIWGLGGVGKTTLAKKVRQQMKEERVFQLVVIAEVHPKADVKTIQERVADWVDIKKEIESHESVELRAALLRRRLLQEKSVLIILDDVWDPIDLKEVGIPIVGDTNHLKEVGIPIVGDTNQDGCRVMVTTRERTVVSTMADMAKKEQKLFQINELNDDEAWELFEKKVGVIPKDDPVWHGVATQVVKKCGGLPVLVLPVAAALKNKELPVWEDALLRLESGLQKNGDNMQEQAYLALKLSYSHLGSDQMALFLFCGLQPQFIYVQYVTYTFGISFLKDYSTVKATRNRVLKLFADLENSCLLQKGKNRDYYTMHDVVHSFARRYQDDVFSPRACSVVKEWPDMDQLQQLTRISLPYCELPELPIRLECPVLEVFLLYSRQQDEKFTTQDHDRFFEAVKKLKVLDLTGMRFSPLPSSLQCLHNLKTLCLDHCIMEGVGVIGNLTQLKCLSLIHANIVHLPEELGKLAQLQVLDLSKCNELNKISPGILSRLKHLEELYMRDSFTQWGLRDKTNGKQINADLVELKMLKKLSTLEIGVADVASFPEDSFCDNLERFFIVVGDCWDWSRNEYVSRTLKLKFDASIGILKKMSVFLNKADDVHLDNSARVEAVYLPELNKEGFGYHLKNLFLQNIHEVKYLVNGKNDFYIAYPMLEELVITGPLAQKSLSNLKYLKISGCDVLGNIFPLRMARCLLKLEHLEVTNCKKMDCLFLVNESLDTDETIYLTHLRKLTLKHLPQLDNILFQQTSEVALVFDGSTLSPTIFNGKIVFPNIENLNLSSLRIHKIWDIRIPNSYGCIKNLITLEIVDCKELKDIFTISIVNNLIQLKVLEIRNCWLLKEIITSDNHGGVNKICLPKLETLIFRHLHSLLRVCTDNLIECENLKKLWIEDCPILETFIASSSSSHQSEKILFDNKVLFPSLEEIMISDMNGLTMLWHEDLHEDSFMNLKILHIEKAISLCGLFSSTMFRKIHTLQKLHLECCHSLEVIFNLPNVESERRNCPEWIHMLKEITLSHLPNLKYVWHEDLHQILSFPNLHYVFINRCSNLDSMVPTSIAQELAQLEVIILEECSMRHIISKEERRHQDVEPIIFEFPNLKKINIWNDQRLTSFYPGKHITNWPALQNVSIFKCPGLKIWEVPQLYDQSAFSQPLFSIEQLVSKLVALSLSSKEIEMILKQELPDVLSYTIRVVHLHDFDGESANLPIKFLQRFPTLENIEVSHSDFVEIFSYGILVEEEGTRALSHIQRLLLWQLPALKHIWNPQSKLDLIIVNLKELNVWECHSLIHLVPPYASFCNLTTLYLRNCESLVSLFTHSTMKSLVQLRELTVKSCNMLTTIVSVLDEEIESETQIFLYKLETLKLVELTSIKSFCSQMNSTLRFPLLVDLVVENCPQMEFFSTGYLNAPKLKNVWLTESRNDNSWEGDLKSTINQMYIEKAIEHRKCFNAIDKDQDGYISLSELRHVVVGATDEVVEQLMRAADLDSDGQLDYDEFVKWMNKFKKC